MTRTVDNSCSWFKPVTMDPNDVLVDATFNQIVSNNKQWVTHCKTKK